MYMSKDCLDKCPYIKELTREITQPQYLMGLFPAADSLSWKMAQRSELLQAQKEAKNCPGPQVLPNPQPGLPDIILCNRLAKIH